MPELPEVETVKRGLSPLITSKVIKGITIRCEKLRYPINPKLGALCKKQRIQRVERRAKYLVIYLDKGYLLIHLGMSGQLTYLSKDLPLKKHDHLDICFEDGSLLRYNDARRFGLIEYNTDELKLSPRIKHLGPEPLSKNFNGDYLKNKAQNRKVPVKQMIMQQDVVVGVGNIYAQEALFKASLSPVRPAKSISHKDYDKLTKEIKRVLKTAINAGGTTLKDFVDSDGKPGYFAQELDVYGRYGKPCFSCKTPLTRITQSGRTTTYCQRCQH